MPLGVVLDSLTIRVRPWRGELLYDRAGEELRVSHIANDSESLGLDYVANATSIHGDDGLTRGGRPENDTRSAGMIDVRSEHDVARHRRMEHVVVAQKSIGRDNDSGIDQFPIARLSQQLKDFFRVRSSDEEPYGLTGVLLFR